ncbi:hypothetical protein GCM10027185_21300 [Spirosoma pulveris]
MRRQALIARKVDRKGRIIKEPQKVNGVCSDGNMADNVATTNGFKQKIPIVFFDMMLIRKLVDEFDTLKFNSLFIKTYTSNSDAINTLGNI